MADNTVLSVFGRKGSGKSTLVRAILRPHRRVIALDTLGEYGPADGFEVAEGLRAGADALTRAEHRRAFRVSLRAPDADDLLDLLGLCYYFEDATIAVEETSFYCSPSYLPPELSQLVRYGRHRRLSQVYVSRRPAEIHRDLTAQSDLIVSFAQHEPRDVDYLSGIAGEDASRVRALPRFRVLAWGDLSKAPPAVRKAMLTPSGDRATVRSTPKESAPHTTGRAGSDGISPPGDPSDPPPAEFSRGNDAQSEDDPHDRGDRARGRVAREQRGRSR